MDELLKPVAAGGVSVAMERYEEEAGRYVLYLDGVRACATDVVALLVDAWTGRVVTHGDPRTVRREYDALRAVGDAESAEAYLLLEGRPALEALNRALEGRVDLHELHLAFTKSAAIRLTDALIARLTRKPLT
jgi:hypothetical protein